MASPTPPSPASFTSRGSWRATSMVFGLTCAWIAAWIAAGPEARPNLFFREGGPIDLLNSTWLMGAAALFWVAHVLAAGSPLGAFWAVAAAGLFLLGIDERFQGHELLSRSLDTPAPMGMRNWSDVVVLGYAAVAAGVLAWRWRELWSARRLRWLGILALGLAAISTAIDSLFAPSATKDLWEESFKVLSGAGLVAVSLEALRIAHAARDQGEHASAPFGFTKAAPALVAVLALAIAVLIPNEPWSELMATNWGPPSSWLVCVLLWVAALPLLAIVPASARGPVAQDAAPTAVGTMPLAIGALLVLFGCGEGLVATRFRMLDDLVVDQFPATAAGALSFMHAPLGIPGSIFLLSASALAVILVCRQRLPGRFLGLSTSGLSLLCAALVVEQLNVGPEESLLAPALRIAGAASFLLASLALTASSRGPEGCTSSPPDAPGHAGT